MDTQLQQLYRENTGAVAFLDESYDLRAGQVFYIVATAVVSVHELDSSRTELRNYYGGETMHAAPMYRDRALASLRNGMALAARQNDGLDVVALAPIAADDPRGEQARRRCIEHIAPILTDEDGVSLFIIDRHKVPADNERDRRTFRDMRRTRLIERHTVEHHTQPSNEPLLGLPDLLAWAYRQEHTNRSRDWFETFRPTTRVHLLG